MLLLWGELLSHSMSDMTCNTQVVAWPGPPAVTQKLQNKWFYYRF